MSSFSRIRRRFSRATNTSGSQQIVSEDGEDISSSALKTGQILQGQTEIDVLPLPFELQAQVLGLLSEGSIFNLRLTCRGFFNLTQAHQGPLIRRFWQNRFRCGDPPCLCDPAPVMYCSRSMPANPTFNDYCHLLRSDVITYRLARTLTRIMEDKILHLQFRDGHEGVSTVRNNILERICLALRHLQHYLISYRKTLDESSDQLDTTMQLAQCCAECKAELVLDYPAASRIEHDILRKLSTPCLLEAHGVFQLLVLALCIKFRPRIHHYTIVGRLLGTRARAEMVDKALTKLIVLGDFDVINDLLNLKPYAARKDFLDKWLHALDHPEAATQVALSHGKWWQRQALVDCPDSAITGSLSAPLSVEKVGPILNALPDLGILFTLPAIWILGGERAKVQSRSADRLLPDALEFIVHGLKYAPEELNYEKIQEDWQKYYQKDEED